MSFLRPAILTVAALVSTSMLFSLPGTTETRSPNTFITYEEAKPAIEATTPDLPPELAALSPEALSTAWPQWVRRRDAEIRARLERGDEDTLVNLLLFGTSFTRTPRVTQENLAKLAGQGTGPQNDVELTDQVVGPWILSRIENLVLGSAAPGGNAHLEFARALFLKRGMDVERVTGQAQARIYLRDNLTRVLREQASFQVLLASAGELSDPNLQVMQRATLYRERGLSLDSSLSVQYGIEKALEELQTRGILAPGSVRHVAIVGPGLDFTDKSSGYDIYPPQTIQPFAVMDSLLRHGLAKEGELDVVTLDLSDRVNQHIRNARERAGRGLGYKLELPLAGYIPWVEGLRAYWSELGSRVGNPAPPAAIPPGAGDVKIRAVRVRPGLVGHVRPLDANIVLQRPSPQAGLAPFDLIIATNILVYYGVFEQSLALVNVSRLLRPQGILLSNDALLMIPAIPMRAAGYTTVVYSSRHDDGDHIFWFQAMPTTGPRSLVR